MNAKLESKTPKHELLQNTGGNQQSIISLRRKANWKKK